MKTSKQRTEEILRRAAVQEQAARVKNRRRAWVLSVTAGFLLLVIALNLLLFIPYPSGLPDISRFSGSEYFPLMQRLNELTYSPPAYKNNFEAWFSGLFSSGEQDNGTDVTPPNGESPADDAVEVTDSQEAGVIEGDLFKRTETHLFYVGCGEREEMTLTAFTLAGAESAACGALEIAAEEGTYWRNPYSAELYLSADGDAALLFCSVYSYGGEGLFTVAVAVDVSDPAHMRETGRMYLSGNYVTSRMVGEEFLLVTNFAVRRDPDFSDESQFLPQFGAPGALESLPMEDIIWSEDAASARYTVLCRFGPDLTLRGCEAFLSFSEQVYVSQDNVFLTRSYTAAQAGVGGKAVRESRTEIACVSYAGGGLSYRGSADVAGRVRNQYSMDEAEDTLRVVTTLSREEGGVEEDGSFVFGPDSRAVNAALYVVDLDDFSLLAALENFAPAGEEVVSVRFEEDVAWVCTAVVIDWSDPVFRIDLSDLSHITYTETGDIDGYSSSLIDFTGGTLLGVGYGEGGSFKAEVYEKAAGAVRPVAAYERETVDFSEDYKSYLIDRENGLLGLHLYDWRKDGVGHVYVLLHFDGYALAPALELPLEQGGDPSTTRACIAEGWLYVVGDWGDIVAAPVPGLA